MIEYKIKELETELPQLFPAHYWVLVQAIEKNTNLIRLFISKYKCVNVNHTELKQKLEKENFAEAFAFRIAVSENYEIIDYNEKLKFEKDKYGRYYSRYLLNNNGKRVRDI